MRKQKETEREIEESSAKNDFFGPDASDEPGSGDTDGEKINHNHFVKLEEFFVKPGEKERSDSKKQDEKKADQTLTPRINF